jgi:hypothetical protein
MLSAPLPSPEPQTTDLTPKRIAVKPGQQPVLESLDSNALDEFRRTFRTSGICHSHPPVFLAVTANGVHVRRQSMTIMMLIGS